MDFIQNSLGCDQRQRSILISVQIVPQTKVETFRFIPCKLSISNTFNVWLLFLNT